MQMEFAAGLEQALAIHPLFFEMQERGRGSKRIYPYRNYNIILQQMFGRFGYHIRDQTKKRGRAYYPILDYEWCHYLDPVDAIANAMIRIEEHLKDGARERFSRDKPKWEDQRILGQI